MTHSFSRGYRSLEPEEPEERLTFEELVEAVRAQEEGVESYQPILPLNKEQVQMLCQILSEKGGGTIYVTWDYTVVVDLS